MTERPPHVGDFVRQVQESTQQYARDVLRENERLFALVTSLHEERAELEQSVLLLKERVRRHTVTESSLLGELAAMRATTQVFTERCLEVEQLNANLATLYVASYRIHGSLDRDEVLTTLREILINLIGTEEFAVFEREGDGATLRCATSFGVDPDRVAPLRIGEGRVGDVLASGAPYLASSPREPLMACIPLTVGDRVTGAVVVYSLLSHKPSLEPADVELLNLLATHGATALYCSTLHAKQALGARI